MITARSARGLHGAGDLGMQVPLSPMQGPPEDSLITGIGQAFYRNGNLMGASPIPQRRGAVAPPRALRAKISTALRPPAFFTPRPTLPAAPAPGTMTRAPQPQPAGTVTYSPPRSIAPTGRTSFWSQTPASPAPLQPPVEFPAIPSATDNSGYTQTNPYDATAPSPTAGVQTSYPDLALDQGGSGYGQDMSVYPGKVTPPATGATDVVKTNADGTVTQQNGEIIEPTTGAVVGTDYWQWAKDNKGKIGIGAALLVGVIVIARVLK